jgi:peptidase E
MAIPGFCFRGGFMRLLLLSNAKREGSGYLEWAEPLFADFFQPAGIKKILFVPYASVTTWAECLTQAGARGLTWLARAS